MRICPGCKKKLYFAEILKSIFQKNNCIKCSKCNTELTIRIKGIVNGISNIVCILAGVCLHRIFNYKIGTFFSFIVALILALTIEILAMFAIITIVGFEKADEQH